MKLRIAQVAAPLIPTPPLTYGGTERIVSELTEELKRRGHKVTLFATGDSRTKAKLKYFYKKAVGIDRLRPIIMLTQAAAAFDREDDFDIIHNHIWEYGIAMAKLIKTPVLTTMHNDYVSPDKRSLEFEYYKNACYYAFISKNQSQRLKGLKYGGVVYNATDTEKYAFHPEKKDYFLFLGNLYKHKGPDIAVRVAKRLKTKLYLTGKFDKGRQEMWFNTHIRPHVDKKNIVFYGLLSFRKKLQLYQNAKCFLFPIRWNEPFGLVMIEAMSCGTPVVAFNRGSVPEVIKHGETGFIADNYREFVSYVKRADEIDPMKCRRWVEKKFSVKAMTDDYLRVYKKMLKSS